MICALRPSRQTVRRLRGSGLDAKLVAFQVGHDGVVRVAARHGGAEPVQSAHLVVHRTGGRAGRRAPGSWLSWAPARRPRAGGRALGYVASDDAARRETPMGLSLQWADAVVLVVGDLERSREFYTKSLGMVLGGEDEDAVVFKTESGGMLILLSHHRADALLGADNVDHGVVAAARTYNVAEVEDVDQACETLRSRGVEFFREPENHPWGIRTAFFRDPDGHVWEISSDLPEE